MALQDKIPAVLEHINKYRPTMEFNQRLFSVLEGQLRKEVEDSLRQEMVSESAYSRACQRIPGINIHKKAVEKLSKTYANTVVRNAEEEIDKELMQTIEKSATTDITMLNAQRLFNSQYSCAIEPFVEDGELRSRVLPAHTFLPFSDDDNNPLKMTVFIKFLPTEVQRIPRTKVSGEEDKPEVREVQLFALYSTEEFLIIEDGGGIRYDKMELMGAGDGKNPFGRIPFVYINRSDFQLIPFVNQEGMDVAVLIPKLLTDLNYATQFQSHSIIWTKNTNMQSLEINPDTVIDLGDRESPDHGDPDIGIIRPEVEIEGILQLVQFELSAYLSTIGIKTSSIGSLMPGREASGISKLIDEGDASNEQKVQSKLFKKYEKEYWTLMAKAQSYFSDAGELNERRKFSDSFKDDFSVIFSEAKAFKSDKEIIDELKMLRDAKLATKRQAIKRLNPDFTEKQLDEYIKELDAEKEKEMNEAFVMAGRMEAQQGEEDDAAEPNGDNQNPPGFRPE